MSEIMTATRMIEGRMELTCENCHRLVPCRFLLDLDGRVVEQNLKCKVCGSDHEISDELRRTFELEYVHHQLRQQRRWSQFLYWLVIVLSALPVIITAVGPVAYVLIYHPSLNTASVVVAILLWVITWIVSMKIYRKPVRFHKMQ